MKLNIAFDLDNCLIDFNAGLQRTFAEQGRTLVPNNNYKIKVVPQASNQIIVQVIGRTYKLHNRTPFFEGAVELCERLHAKSQQPILIISSRPIWCAHWTHQLIANHLQVPYILCFANKNFSKANYLGDIDYFVEDRRMVVRELVSYGKKVFMPTYSYNKMPSHPDIWPIKGVHKLISHIDKFIIEEKKNVKIPDTADINSLDTKQKN